MALYVKVFTAFYTNRKTARLRARLGDDAFWVPPRLWAYAAENQANGDFTGYSPEEIAVLIGYPKDACSMLEALQEAGFMDGMQIHDWQQHNGYHSTYATRARAAAEARWAAQKEKKQKKEQIQRHREESIGDKQCLIFSKHCNKHASSMQEVVEYVVSLGLPETDGRYLWDKWKGNGWTNNNKAIRDWKATVRSWQTAKYLPSQKPNGSKPPTERERDEQRTGLKTTAGATLKRL